jgi:hypothetical protein
MHKRVTGFGASQFGRPSKTLFRFHFGAFPRIRLRTGLLIESVCRCENTANSPSRKAFAASQNLRDPQSANAIPAIG